MDDLDREILTQRLEIAERNERAAFRQAELSHADWLRAVEAREGMSIAQHRYQRAETQLSAALDQLEQARAALRSAELPRVVA